MLYTLRMIVLFILCGIGIGLAIIGDVIWSIVGWRLRRTLRSGLSVRSHLEDPIEEELVTIVVPAHNEERIISRCAEALMSQRWSKLEIIFVADRCTDGTVDLLRRTVDGDERVRIIENNSCPDSWAGKCNAARLGAAGASGRYLIFMDADTIADPDLIRAAVTSAKARGASLLSLLTKLTMKAVYERRTQTAASMLLLTLYPPERVNRDEASRPFANGQFMLFEREWYEKIRGHEAVRDDLLEDIAFARCIDEHGGRVNLLSADGLLECSMYSSSAAFRRGWQRIFIEACRRKPARMRQWATRLRLLGLFIPSAILMACIVGIVTLAMGSFWWGLTTILVSVIALFVQAIVLAAIYRSFHQPPISIWRFPMGCEDLARILCEGARVLEQGKPVLWGGREYILEPR